MGIDVFKRGRARVAARARAFSEVELVTAIRAALPKLQEEGCELSNRNIADCIIKDGLLNARHGTLMLGLSRLGDPVREELGLPKLKRHTAA